MGFKRRAPKATGHYRVIVADPPWQYADQGSRMAPNYAGRGRRHSHYQTMSEDLICGMSSWVDGLMMTDSVLFLWAPHALVVDGTALRVADAWGFFPKQEIIWRKMTRDNKKPRLGGGHYTRVCTEPMLLCTRGKAASLVKSHSIPNIFDAPRQAHSAKPDESYRLIESLFDGPYLELFARRRYSDEWDVWGNEV